MRLVEPDPSSMLLWARWSATAREVAYAVQPLPEHATTQDESTAELCVVVAVTGGPRRCFGDARYVQFGGYAGPGYPGHFGWSPEGDHLVVGGRDLRVLEVPSGDVSVLVPRGGSSSLRRRMGGSTAQIAFMVEPSWSPSGRYVAATAIGSGRGRLDATVVFDRDGRSVAVARSPTASRIPARWSPDEDLLASVVAERDEEVFRVFLLDPSTGRRREVFSFEPSVHGGVFDVEWSPDGEHLAVATMDAQRWEIAIVDPRGSDAPALIDVGLVRLSPVDPLRDWGP